MIECLIAAAICQTAIAPATQPITRQMAIGGVGGSRGFPQGTVLIIASSTAPAVTQIRCSRSQQILYTMATTSSPMKLAAQNNIEIIITAIAATAPDIARQVSTAALIATVIVLVPAIVLIVIATAPAYPQARSSAWAMELYEKSKILRLARNYGVEASFSVRAPPCLAYGDYGISIIS